MQVSVQKLPKSAIKLTITAPVDMVKASQQKVLAKIVKDAELDGFRKGKAPVDIVKQKINPQKFDSEVMSDLIKTFYPQAIEEQKLSPIISPKIEINQYDSEKDFTFTAETAVRPEITIGDYKKAVKESYDKKVEGQKKLGTEGVAKKDRPDGKELQNNDEEEGGHTHSHMSPNDVVDAILSVTQVEIPDMVLDEEVNRMLSRLVQQLQPLNLGMDAYLKSIDKTGDQIRAEYAQVAQKNVASEMALVEIVNKEAIQVDDKEIEATVSAMGDSKLQERYLQNPLEKGYVKAIIAKNKLIWKLISEVEGEEHHHNEQLDSISKGGLQPEKEEHDDKK